LRSVSSGSLKSSPKEVERAPPAAAKALSQQVEQERQQQPKLEEVEKRLSERLQRQKPEELFRRRLSKRLQQQPKLKEVEKRLQRQPSSPKEVERAPPAEQSLLEDLARTSEELRLWGRPARASLAPREDGVEVRGSKNCPKCGGVVFGRWRYATWTGAASALFGHSYVELAPQLARPRKFAASPTLRPGDGRADFERILRLWRAADCLPALVFPQRAWESAAWSSGNCYFLELTQVFRCDDPAFLETLQLLRTAMPSKTQLNKICRGHKAWAGDKPAADDLRRLLREHPEATIVAATTQGVAELNALALEALHPRAAPLATIAGAFEDNPENYVAGKLRDDRLPVPADVPIHRGAKLYLTRNVRKADDYVNGMRCEVLSFDAARQVLWVRTDTGKRLPITPWHDPDHWGVCYFPVRLGYCTTVHKVQGDEFPFIIIYLDAPNMPAVGYTAMSRVKNARSYLLGGCLTPQHFAPVTMR
ncbi:unnamed protein product, partial [Effrenium voratum]